MLWFLPFSSLNPMLARSSGVSDSAPHPASPSISSNCEQPDGIPYKVDTDDGPRGIQTGINVSCSSLPSHWLFETSNVATASCQALLAESWLIVVFFLRIPIPHIDKTRIPRSSILFTHVNASLEFPFYAENALLHLANPSYTLLDPSLSQLCNATTEGQESRCQTSFINSIEDFCVCIVHPNKLSTFP